MPTRYANGHGFDWPSHIAEKRALRQAWVERDMLRAQRRQAEQRKAEELREQEGRLLAMNLYDEPVNPAIRAAAAETVNRRWSLRLGAMQW